MGFGRVVYNALRAWIKAINQANKPHIGPPQVGHPQKHLSSGQRKIAEGLSSDYSHLGLLLDDIRAIIAAHPNLSEAQLQKLLDRYLDVINKNPNLVTKYGTLAVFEEFIALSAYDPAHGGNYTNRKPSVERELDKGMEEAVAELGAMEMGLVLWPMAPSTNTDYEGTDLHGQAWDVKAPRSTTPEGKPIFNAAKEADKMRKDFDNNEKVIIDDRNITPEERKELYEQLKTDGNDGRVVWWPIDPKP